MQKGDYWKEWEVVELLGSGSYGNVFKIRRKGFDNFIEESALKVIRIPQNPSDYQAALEEGMSEPVAVAYFESIVTELSKEFTLMSSLKGNSNIVSFEDYEVNKLTEDFGWEIFIRMELLTPLTKHISKNRVTAADVARIGIDICKALELCEAENIIHRDIKPENIFVSKHGDYKLGDFGIAKRLENVSVSLTKKGTLSYMAPEVYRGLPYTSSVDIYSLGIVLYRLLNNNRLPFMPPFPEEIKFQDREMARARRMNGEELPPPANATDNMARVILKACAFDPEKRFQNAHSMRTALEAVLSGDRQVLELQLENDEAVDETATMSALTAQESTASPVPAKKTGPNRTIMLAGIAALVIALAAGIFFMTRGGDGAAGGSAAGGSTAAGDSQVEAAEDPYNSETNEITFPVYNGETVTVTNADELKDAVDNAVSGTTIELQSGDYDLDAPIQIVEDGIKLVGTGDSKPVLNSAISVGGKDVTLENLSVYITDGDKTEGNAPGRGIYVESYDGGNTYMLNTDVTLRYHAESMETGVENSSPLYMQGCVIDVSDTADDYWYGYMCVGVYNKLVATDSSFSSNDTAIYILPVAQEKMSDEDIKNLMKYNTFNAGQKILQ